MSIAPGLIRPERPEPLLLGALARDLGLLVEGDLRGVAATGIAARTEDLRPGDVFAALPGARTHGAMFAARAAAAGAVALLTDPAGAELAVDAGLPVLLAADPRAVLGHAAARLHRTRERMPLLLGVTGTNGKTTTVHLIEQVLDRLGIPAGVSSTASRGRPGARVPSRLTTPEADELHALLAAMAERGARAAAVEVSAQALVRSRVTGLRFHVAGFTNLTHDHLDDFGSMEAYHEAKATLFTPELSERAVICTDTPAGRRLAASARVPVTTIAAAGTPADWQVRDVEVAADGTRFLLTGPAGEHLRTRIDAIGAHQALDAALAIVMVVDAGHGFDRVATALQDGFGAGVEGRLERVPGTVDPAVFVDVGHTPDALAKSLTALRPLTAGRLVVLFGADGDRDASKRAPMGAVAARLADAVLVHDHHSRFEDRERIRSMVLAGAASGAAEVHDVPDPRDAIRRALVVAGPRGTVLWAGTGRTEYRDVGGVKHPFSFWDEAAAAAQEHRSAVAAP